MDMTKYGKLLLSFFLFPAALCAQDTLNLSRKECEAIFLKENLSLLAGRLNIPEAEAKVVQARLWPNPELSIDEINIGASRKKLAVFGDELQGFNGGKFGRNQQISLNLEQLIQPAGKRKKLIAAEQAGVDKAKQDFEELLRGLKTEFRNQLTQLQYLQLNKAIYQNQLNSIQQLTYAYSRQVELGNIPKGEYVRLKALELEIAKDISELNQQLSSTQKELNILMGLPPVNYLVLTSEGYWKEKEQFQLLHLKQLVSEARSLRPDFKAAGFEQIYHQRIYDYERAQRMPDLRFNVGYDRGGNFMYNFVGVGLTIDLPLFNRNQGNIRSAQVMAEKAGLDFKHKKLIIENEVAQACRELTAAIAFAKRIEPGYESTLDELLASYTRNFAGRHISLLEYLDFLEAYLENKKIILDAARELNEKAEELNFAVGKDLIN